MGTATKSRSSSATDVLHAFGDDCAERHGARRLCLSVENDHAGELTETEDG